MDVKDSIGVCLYLERDDNCGSRKECRCIYISDIQFKNINVFFYPQFIIYLDDIYWNKIEAKLWFCNRPPYCSRIIYYTILYEYKKLNTIIFKLSGHQIIG